MTRPHPPAIDLFSGKVTAITGGLVYAEKLCELLRADGHVVRYHDLESVPDAFVRSHALLKLRRFFCKYPFFHLRYLLSRSVFIVDVSFAGWFPLINRIRRRMGRGRAIALIHHFDHYDSSESKRGISSSRRDEKLRARLECFDTFVTVSAFTRGELESLGIPSRKIVIAPPSFDKSAFEFDRLAPADARRREILCVSHCISRKGLEFLVHGYALANANGFTLRIVSSRVDEAYFRETLQPLILKHELGAKLIFERNISRAQLRERFQNAAIFALPSLKEGFGIVLLEAMYCGLPIIASNCTAIPELVRHQQDGLLVEPGNANAIADAISTLTSDADLRRKYAAAGRARAHAFPDWPQTLEPFLALCK